MDVDDSAAAMNVDAGNPKTANAGSGDDADMKRFTMEFLSHYCR
jgi:hypothetical protein